MYTRPPQGRFPKGMRIPQNYSGSTFRPTAEGGAEAAFDLPAPYEPPPLSVAEEPTETISEAPSVSESASKDETSTPALRLNLRNLFPSLGKDGSGLGSEELLLLALIFLFAGNEGADDLTLLLLLLLLIK